MKICTLIILLNVFAIGFAVADNQVVVQTDYENIHAKAWCPEIFETNRDVSICYSILNRSNKVFGLLFSNGVRDVKINLAGPDGEKIVGFHEGKDSKIESANIKRRFVKSIEPNAECNGDPIPVSKYWPLKFAGEYRCEITLVVYPFDNSGETSENALLLNSPISINLPEIRFVIKSIDATYKSPAEQENFKGNSFLNDESQSKDQYYLGLKKSNWCIIGAAIIFVFSAIVVFVKLRQRAGDK